MMRLWQRTGLRHWRTRRGVICPSSWRRQPAVSQHLRVLRDAGLVTARKDGRHRYYQLRPAGLTELRDWIDQLERFWQGRLAALGNYLQHTEPHNPGDHA